MEHFLAFGLILFCSKLDLASAQTTKHYFLLGTSVTLSPPSTSGKLTGVTWRHNDNFAAEWSSDTEMELYRNFKGRTDLDINTGIIVIRDMTAAEAGTYSVEINGKKLDNKYEVMQIEEVPTPKVWPKPAEKVGTRTFDCDAGDVSKAEPVTYLWDINADGSWREDKRTITIEDDETTRRKEKFSCKIKNPVSEKTSEPIENPFFPKPNHHLLGLIAIPFILGGIIAGFWKRDAIKRRFCPGNAAGNNASVAHSPVSVTEGDKN